MTDRRRQCPQEAPKVRVLQVVGSLKVGGAETMVVTAASRLLRGAAGVDFLVFGDEIGHLEHRVRNMGGRILRMNSPEQLGAIRFISQLTRLLEREGPYDAVHSHVNYASGFVLAGATNAAVPIRIAHSHSTQDLTAGPRRWVYRKISQALILNNATVLAACAEDAGEHLFGSAWKARGVVVPNGVDLDRFASARSFRQVAREELGLPPGTLVAGAIARLAPVKNHAFMIDVVEHDRAKSGNLHLLLIGTGPLRSQLEARVSSLGLQDRVRFLGLRDDVPRLLGALDLVLMPSHYEGLPMCLVEAQAAGVPTIVSEAVTEEADLGLGLVHRLPIDSSAAWRDAIVAHRFVDRDEETIRDTFRAMAYDSEGTARFLAKLYGAHA